MMVPACGLRSFLKDARFRANGAIIPKVSPFKPKSCTTKANASDADRVWRYALKTH
jgi:hypothetical protein